MLMLTIKFSYVFLNYLIIHDCRILSVVFVLQIVLWMGKVERTDRMTRMISWRSGSFCLHFPYAPFHANNPMLLAN